jgi:hypothetical protein
MAAKTSLIGKCPSTALELSNMQHPKSLTLSGVSVDTLFTLIFRYGDIDTNHIACEGG